MTITTQPHDHDDKSTKFIEDNAPFEVYRYDATHLEHFYCTDVHRCQNKKANHEVTWINVGSDRIVVESLCNQFQIHQLLQDDILTQPQRPKANEIDGVIFILMHMLFYGAEDELYNEQITLALCGNTLISFQEDREVDLFDSIRARLQIASSKLRNSGADYLFYQLIETIVQKYFVVLDHLGEEINHLEEAMLIKQTKHHFQEIRQLRKQVLMVRQNISPMISALNDLLHVDSKHINPRTVKYLRDVQGQIVLAHEIAVSRHDAVMSLQDLYVNNLNFRTNEVIRTLTILTTVMAPATVIGGIFGMNFDVIPMSHNPIGFYLAVGLMLLISIIMLGWFAWRGWFGKE